MLRTGGVRESELTERCVTPLERGELGGVGPDAGTVSQAAPQPEALTHRAVCSCATASALIPLLIPREQLPPER